MRVTNDTLRTAFLNAIEGAQRRLLQTQTQVTTGRRINLPSDDPFAAARIAEIGASLGELDQYQTNATLARNRLGFEEEALSGIVDNLQRVRELAVQANNAPLADGDRRAIAAELHERLDALLDVANSVDSSGQYLFAGYKENTRPFAMIGGTVEYAGDEGERLLQVGPERFVPVNHSGAALLERIASGNGTFALAAAATNTGTGILGAGTVIDPAAYVRDTYTITFTAPGAYEVTDGAAVVVATGTYTPGQTITFAGTAIELSGEPAAGDEFTVSPSGEQSAFTTVQRLIAALERPANEPAARAQMHTEIGQVLQDVDQAVNHVVGARAEIGARMRAVDDQLAMNEGFAVQLTQTLSDVRDLDYTEALSRLSQQLFGLEAAQQAYARVQGLSLFRFL